MLGQLGGGTLQGYEDTVRLAAQAYDGGALLDGFLSGRERRMSLDRSMSVELRSLTVAYSTWKRRPFGEKVT